MAVDLTKIKVGDYLGVVGKDRQEKHEVTKVKGGVITTKCFIGERLGDHDYRFSQDRGWKWNTWELGASPPL
jgi:hypothetical protein